MPAPVPPNESQLNRVENKLDQLIETSTANKVELKNHIALDNKAYKVLAGIVLFVASTHAVEAVEFLSKML